MNFTELILALLTLLSGCGWFLNHRKYRQEVESLKADNQQKNLNLGTDFVEKFRSLIAQPLEDEVMKLRTEVNLLKYAIEKINDCPYSARCPVRARLRNEQESAEHGDKEPNH